MQELIEKLSKMEEEDFAAYREVIEYCASRITREEGIPAIIGLDDLTSGGHTVFQGAPMDERMHIGMAFDALIFNWLYCLEEGRDPHYPSIAPAMSALAEKQFCMNPEQNEPQQYRAMFEDKTRDER